MTFDEDWAAATGGGEDAKPADEEADRIPA